MRLDCYTVSAKTARHRDVHIAVERHRRTDAFQIIQLDRIRQAVAVRKPLRDDVDPIRCQCQIASVSGIDARRIADAIFYLQLQCVPLGIYIHIVR